MRKILSCLFTTFTVISMISCSLPNVSNAANDPIENTSKSVQSKPKKCFLPLGKSIKTKKTIKNAPVYPFPKSTKGPYNSKKCFLPLGKSIKPKKEPSKTIKNAPVYSRSETPEQEIYMPKPLRASDLSNLVPRWFDPKN